VSEQNVELHRHVLAAFNARDAEALVALTNPGVEGHSVFAEVGGAVYHGHEGIRRYFRDIEGTWGSDIRIEPEAYFDLGEQTLLFYVAHGRGRTSGAEVVGTYAQVFSWRDGLGVYWKAYAHREEALRDLGVSEDALERISP
jgi:ketosteroid isomerase-like protein